METISGTSNEAGAANINDVSVSEGLAISALVNEGNGGSSIVPGITAICREEVLV